MSEENNETVSPEFLTNRVDVKNYTISVLNSVLKTLTSDIPGVTADQDQKMGFVTNFGIVFGDIADVPDKDSDLKQGNDFFKYVLFQGLEGRNKVLAEFEQRIGVDKVQPVNNSSSIVVENATIIPFGALKDRVNLAVMVLFTDQIVGVFTGKP